MGGFLLAHVAVRGARSVFGLASIKAPFMRGLRVPCSAARSYCDAIGHARPSSAVLSRETSGR